MFDLSHQYSRVIGFPSATLLFELEKFVNGALVQIGRVERAKRSLNLNARKRRKVPTANTARLFLDAHFYFICIGHVDKLLGQLCRSSKNPALMELHGRFTADFEPEIRNDLEHLDERAVGRKHKKDAHPDEVNKWVGDFVNFDRDKLTFGGKKYPVNKEAAKRLRKTYRDVIAIIRRDYALKDTHFVEMERQKARISRIVRHFKHWEK